MAARRSSEPDTTWTDCSPANGLNYQKQPRVVTDLDEWNRIREELPLSTRVHELAKELGLKSAELLERIQSWGLDVKASNFASLDPATVERIRELMARSAPGGGPASPPAQARSAASAPAPSPAGSPSQPARPSSPDASATRAAAACSGEPGETPVRAAPAPARPASPQMLAPGSSPVAAPVRPVSGPGAAAVAPGSAPATSAAGLAAAIDRVAAGNRRFTAAPVTSRQLFIVAIGRGPPFGSHAASRFRRRDRRARPWAGAGLRSRPAQPGSPAGSTGGEAPGGFQPLKPGDYMSSAGIRTMTPRVSPAATFCGDAAASRGRRRVLPARFRQRWCSEGPPLPQVAAASASAAHGCAPPGRFQPGSQDPASRQIDDQGRAAGADEIRPARSSATTRRGRPRTARQPARRPSRSPERLSRCTTRRRQQCPWRCSRGAAGPGGGLECSGSASCRRRRRGRTQVQGRTAWLGSRSGRPPRPAQRAGRRAPRHLACPRRSASWRMTTKRGELAPGDRKIRGGQRLAVAPPRKTRSRDRTADHRPQPFRGDRCQGQRPDPQADGHESDRHHQRHARRRVATMLAMEFGIELDVVHPRTAEDDLLDSFASTATSENLRAPAPGHHDPGTR